MAANKTHKHSVGKNHAHEYGTKEKFNVSQKLYFGKLHRLIGISFIANNHPVFYEMYLSYIFPPRDLRFELEVVKH